MAGRPADACPYPRPFADDFADCPAYRASQFLAVDMQYRPLRAVNTCAHLDARSLPGRQAGFYAHCIIGDAAARRAWSGQFEADRLARIRALSKALGEATRAASREMWDAKAEQLRAVRAGQKGGAQTRRVRQAAAAYEAQARRLLARHSEELEQLGVRLDDVLKLLHEAVYEWAARTSVADTYRPSPELMKRFPPELRAFLSPNVL